MLKNEQPDNGFEMLWKRMPLQMQVFFIGLFLFIILVASLFVGAAQMEECTRVHPEWYCVLSY